MKKGIVIPLLLVVLVMGAGTAYFIGVATLHMTAQTPTALSVPNDGCGFYGSPQYIIRLIQQVEGNGKFLAAGHSLQYVFESYSEEGPVTGTVDGKPFYSPPATELVFYAFGTGPISCSGESFSPSTVVGALWVNVPKNPDGSYNFTGIGVNYTPGLFVNQTSSQ